MVDLWGLLCLVALLRMLSVRGALFAYAVWGGFAVVLQIMFIVFVCYLPLRLGGVMVFRVCGCN